MNNRFRFGPPKARLVTVSGTRIFPISSPSGVMQWTPSAALVQMFPSTSTRKPSGTPGSMTANVLRDESFPSAETSNATISWAPCGSCVMLEVGDVQDLFIGREGKAVRFAKLVSRNRQIAALWVDPENAASADLARRLISRVIAEDSVIRVGEPDSVV